MDPKAKMFTDAIKARQAAGRMTLVPNEPPVPAPFEREVSSREDSIEGEDGQRIPYIVTTIERWEAAEYLDLVEQQASLALQFVRERKERAKEK